MEGEPSSAWNQKGRVAQNPINFTALLSVKQDSGSVFWSSKSRQAKPEPGYSMMPRNDDDDRVCCDWMLLYMCATYIPVHTYMQTKAKRVPQLEPLIIRLKKMNMLPAIWFILSRKDCDLSAIRATSGAVELTTEAEQAAIRSELVALQEDQPEAVREELVPALVRGVASHHAGHLPGWKALVEKLFQK